MIEKQQETAYQFIEKTININHKLSHAYLIETNGYADYMHFVKDMIKMILSMNQSTNMVQKINQDVDNHQYPDIKYITPDGFWIKKEQLLSVEREFSKKSMLNNKLIYVIDGAEKLNDSSANTILKFLEEPKEDIIAILITNNRYQVIDTIISRCQVISLYGQATILDKVSDELLHFFQQLSNKKKLMIHYEEYLLHLFSTRLDALNTVKLIENIIYNYLNDYDLDDNLRNILNQYGKDRLVKYLSIIHEEAEKLEYNVNIKLWLNYFIIRMMEVV